MEMDDGRMEGVLTWSGRLEYDHERWARRWRYAGSRGTCGVVLRDCSSFASWTRTIIIDDGSGLTSCETFW
jgi:hypothetical protein